jgi:histidinol-phosphatase (PHP family)
VFLADYHTHSAFSSDGRDGMPELLAAAARAGLDELCVTDHCDMGDAVFPAAERVRAFEETRAQNETGVRLLLGIELGEGIHNKPLAEKRAAGQPYDFVIGSHHALREEKDFYYTRYTSEAQCRSLLARYFAELAELAEWGCFDVLGHIAYPLRYMRRDGFMLDLLPRYEAELRELFGLLARSGRGIELNTKEPVPMTDILSLFRECGGEVVTAGSDAHSAAGVGNGVAEGLEICREAGFRTIAAFEQRRVRFENI